MASLIDVFGRLLLDDEGRGFVKSAVKAGEKAGDQAGKSMGQRVAAGLKASVGPAARVMAAGAGLVFGAMSAGAAQLEEVQARFRAETGATAEEAKHASEVINRVAGDQRASLEAVAEAAIKVRKDLGAVGPEADKLTEDFVRFARVTRQDAGAAVSDFDDILDNWGLTTADAAGLMDKLLVSNQRFGGSLADNQKTLAALAPALRAANFQLDDGIALLGLFGAKGLDANQGAAAFAKALTKVKSPEELQQLITDISNTEDPFQRAAKAADLFGARAGAKLANALGGANLDDFAISTEDAADATLEAADALDSTWGARFQRLMSQAGAALRGFGADFGPALTGAAALASIGGSLGLDKVLGKAFTKLGGSALVKAAATNAGLVIGAIFSGAMFVAEKMAGVLGSAFNAMPGSGVLKAATGKLGGFLGTTLGKLGAAAFAGVMLVEVVNTYNRIKAELDEQLAAINKDAQAQLVAGTDEALATQKAALEKGINDLNGVWDFGLFTSDARTKLQSELDATNAEIARRAAAIPDALAEGMNSNTGPVAEATANMVGPVVSGTEAAERAARQSGQQTAEEYAGGLREKRSAVDQAMAQLIEDLKNAMAPAKEIAHDVGLLTSKELARGLKSNDPLVRAQAQATRETIEARLAEVIAAGGKAGKKAQEALAAALKSKDPVVRAQAQRTKEIVDAKLLAIKGEQAGHEAGQGVADGLNDKATAVGRAAAALARAAIQTFLGKLYASGAHQGGQQEFDGRAEGGPVKAGEAYWVGEHRRRELFVPEVNGRIIPEPDVQSGTPTQVSGGDTYNTQIVLPERKRDEFEILERASWYQRTGLINPRPRTAGSF